MLGISKYTTISSGFPPCFHVSLFLFILPREFEIPIVGLLEQMTIVAPFCGEGHPPNQVKWSLWFPKEQVLRRPLFFSSSFLEQMCVCEGITWASLEIWGRWAKEIKITSCSSHYIITPSLSVQRACIPRPTTLTTWEGDIGLKCQGVPESHWFQKMGFLVWSSTTQNEEK